MSILGVAKQRCSVRNYSKDAIEKEKLDKLLEVARVAPTAANIQSQRLLVVHSSEGLEKLSKGVNYHGAPLAIIVCGDHSNVFVRPYDKKDMVSIDAAIIALGYADVAKSSPHRHAKDRKALEELVYYETF